MRHTLRVSITVLLGAISFVASRCDHKDTTTIHLLGLAQPARWFNDLGEQLPFPGSETDSRGFARLMNAQLEDGVSYNVLQSHPRWVANGTIEGHFDVTVPPVSMFSANVGFIDGATASDGVKFQVFWIQKSSEMQEPTLLTELVKTYNNSLAIMKVDLNSMSGQTGTLILKVSAMTTAARDWAVWNDPVITLLDNDIDKDLIDDDLESTLLQRFSPFYRFSRESISTNPYEEQFRPTDAIWYIRHSDLVYGDDENSHVVTDRTKLAANTAGLINSVRVGVNSSLASTLNKTNFRLNVYNEFRSGWFGGDGFDWEPIKRQGNIGLYGHVVGTADPNILQIEYWQFFGYSQGTAYKDPVGNLSNAFCHEGDWTTIHLLFNVAGNSATAIYYYHHGDISEKNLTHLLTPVNSDVKQDGSGVQFFRDDKTGDFTHPVVFVEWGAHELWPGPEGSKFGSPNHDGVGRHAYLTRDVPNLGEVENPMSEAGRIIMQFNGFWGAFNQTNSNPPGPSLHTGWQWPQGSVLRQAIPNGDFED